MYGGANSETPAWRPVIQRSTYTFLGSVRPCVMLLGIASSRVCAPRSEYFSAALNSSPLGSARPRHENPSFIRFDIPIAGGRSHGVFGGAAEGEEFECGRGEDSVFWALVTSGGAHGCCEIHTEEAQHKGGDVRLKLAACAAALRRHQCEILIDAVLVRFVGVDIDDRDHTARNLFDLPGDDGQLIEVVRLEQLDEHEIVVFGDLKPLLLKEAAKQRAKLACTVASVALHRKNPRALGWNIDASALETPYRVHFEHVVRITRGCRSDIVAFIPDPEVACKLNGLSFHVVDRGFCGCRNIGRLGHNAELLGAVRGSGDRDALIIDRVSRDANVQFPVLAAATDGVHVLRGRGRVCGKYANGVALCVVRGNEGFAESVCLCLRRRRRREAQKQRNDPYFSRHDLFSLKDRA